MSFHIFSCDNMEQLAAHYCRCRTENPEQFYSGDLFVREKIIVPSRGIKQWLSRFLVDQGVFLANVEFSHIRRFTTDLLKTYRYDNDYSPQLFDAKTMTWRIMNLLQDERTAGEFPELQAYLNGIKKDESGALRCYSLAAKIASLFASYLENVPEHFVRGSAKESDHWQIKVWKKLCEDSSGNVLCSPADRMMDFLTAESLPEHFRKLPPVTVFGVGSISPAALAILKKLAQVTTINFFCINPANALWKNSYEAWKQNELTGEPAEVQVLFEASPVGYWALHQRHFFKMLLGLVPLLGLPAELLKCDCSWKILDADRKWHRHILRDSGKYGTNRAFIRCSGN